jgi:hypothetical protein
MDNPMAGNNRGCRKFFPLHTIFFRVSAEGKNIRIVDDGSPHGGSSGETGRIERSITVCIDNGFFFFFFFVLMLMPIVMVMMDSVVRESSRRFPQQSKKAHTSSRLPLYTRTGSVILKEPRSAGLCSVDGVQLLKPILEGEDKRIIPCRTSKILVWVKVNGVGGCRWRRKQLLL